jgi:DNA-binding GntR family transcriptional regulator
LLLATLLWSAYALPDALLFPEILAGMIKKVLPQPAVASVSGLSATKETGARRMTLDDTVYEHIKSMILAHQLRPGHKLAPQHLADQLSVSRTPIRQALERLYQEGYAIRIADRGYYVAEIDSHEARDLYQARLAIEPFLVRITMSVGITREQNARLDELQEVYLARIADQSVMERVVADQEFHLYLASLSRNEYLLHSLRNIFERLNLKRRIDGYWPDQGKRGRAGAREHREILRAIRGNRTTEALDLLQAHIQQAWVQYEAHLLKIQMPA